MNLSYPLILGSKSPRRKEILTKAGFEFTAEAKDTEESYPEDMPHNEVAAFLAEKKAKAFAEDAQYSDKIILTADTTVLIDNELLEKPLDENEAFSMLSKLSGRAHQVVSGFCVLQNGEFEKYSDETLVYFNPIEEKIICDYIRNHKPFDKAGAYGIQEGIGLTHIEKLEGSYFTVMGLPIHKVYQALSRYSIGY
ncbi:Maf family protein [uncultured Marivirga sp.]|mgnify:CR=1 FL=1|uniref:Maf family protein n=1 Tax=uncultured Marivirga sp. TaxID=1123707 RepID=UPI0030EC5B4A|tara:strand:+ start:144675 stop:145259 length:585 start_codon:yes stop_codon:yes gene_type:complete